jgi:hypothetical protein
MIVDQTGLITGRLKYSLLGNEAALKLGWLRLHCRCIIHFGNMMYRYRPQLSPERICLGEYRGTYSHHMGVNR